MSLKNGFYHVKVSARSGQVDAGEGLVIIRGDIVQGGDASYLYRGLLNSSSPEATAGELHAKLDIKQYQHGRTSVFAPHLSLELDLHGTFAPGSFSLAGSPTSVPDHAFEIAGRYVGAAL